MENEFYKIDLDARPAWPGRAVEPEESAGSVPPVMPEHFVPGIAYVPFQNMKTVYDPEQGFKTGTIFPELNYPWVAGGDRG